MHAAIAILAVAAPIAVQAYARQTAELQARVLYVSRSKRVDVSGVTFKNSKFWTTHFYDCEDVLVHDCEIRADILKDPRGKELKGPSTDGIDIDKCRRFTVRNVTFSVNDDGIAVYCALPDPIDADVVPDLIYTRHYGF